MAVGPYEGLKRMRTCIIILAVWSIFGYLTGHVLHLSLPSLLHLPSPGSGAQPSGVMSLIWLGFALGTVGAMISFVAYLYMFRGFMAMKGSDASYGIGETGMLLQMAGPVLLIIAVLLVLPSLSGGILLFSLSTGVIAAAAVGVIGAIASFIGAILAAVGLFRVGRSYGNVLVRMGAVLWFIVFVVALESSLANILGLLMELLLFVGFSRMMKQEGRSGQNPPMNLSPYSPA